MLMVAVSVLADTIDRAVSASERDPSGAADVEVLASDSTGLPESAVAEIRRIPGVESALPVVRFWVELSGPDGAERALVLGVDRDATLRLARRQGRIVVESGSADPRGPGLLLSPDLAREIGSEVGASVVLATSRGRKRVTGVGRISGGALDDLGTAFAILRLHAAQALFERRGRVDAVYLVVTPGRESAVISAVERRLKANALVGRPGTLSRGFERVFAPLRATALLAAVAAMFIAIALVYNTVAMTLAERRRELAMALALGAARRQVMASFLMDAALLGALGSAVGLGAGLLLVDALADWVGALPFIQETSAVVEPLRLAVAFVIGLGGALAGAAVPVARIAGVEPVVAVSPEAVYEWRAPPSRVPRHGRTVVVAVGAAAGGSLALTLAAVAPDRTALAALSLGLWLVVAVVLLRYTLPLALMLLRRLAARPLATLGRLAFDDLLRNPGRVTLTAAAVMITCGLLIGVSASNGSYRASFETEVERGLGAPLYVVPPRDGVAGLEPPLSPAFTRRVADLPSVRGAYPERFIALKVEGEPAVLRAVPVARAARDGMPSPLVSVGDDQPRFVAALREHQVAISELLRRKLAVEEGERVGLGTSGDDRALRVGAVWEGVSTLGQVLIEYDDYARLWDDHSATRLAIYPSAEVSRERAARDLDNAITRSGVPARVVTREQLVGEGLDLVDSLLDFGRAIQLACLLVAAIAVANTMFMTVLERRREFALQRMLGMSRRELRGSLLVEAAAVGYVGGVGGGLFGAAAGYTMTRASSVGFGWQLEFELPALLVAGVAAAAAAVAALAALPAIRVALRAPMSIALRDELGGAGAGARVS